MDVTLRIRGDQIGTFAGFFDNGGNNEDRVLTLSDVTAVGTSADIFTVLVEQVNPGVDEFQNGQLVTITDPSGNTLVSRTGIQPDREQDLGAGDEHLVLFNDGLVIDLAGLPATPTDVQYANADQAADPATGDNDGNLDFASFPCLAAGTMIQTPAGEVDVAGLWPGDQVICAGDILRRVMWVGKRTLQLQPGVDDQRPMRFDVGSLGPDLPHRPLIVSQGHRMCLSGELPFQLFGHPTVLAVAKGLQRLKGVSV
ncbi:MAG: Hint domain-containing protein, partial [Pseudomonadota bacterium]